MVNTTLEPRDTPTDPENWVYLGDHGDYLHYWTYKKGGKAIYECYIRGDSIYSFRLIDNISGKNSQVAQSLTRKSP